MNLVVFQGEANLVFIYRKLYISILLKLDYCMFVCLFTKGSCEKDRGEKAHLQFR